MLTTAWLKERFLAGIPLEDSRGKPMPSVVLEGTLASAIRYFERKYGVLLEPSFISCGAVPDGKTPVNPNNYPVIQRHGLDYDPQGWHGSRWHNMSLPFGPVREVDYLALTFGTVDTKIVEFPSDWWRVSNKRWALRIFPGQSVLEGQNVQLAYYVAQMRTPNNTRIIPQAWALHYQAGYDNVLQDEPDLATAIGMKAIIGALPQVAMLNEGTLSNESVSVDGLSQSRGYPVSAQSHRYSPLQSDLENKLLAFEKHFFAANKGVKFTSA